MPQLAVTQASSRNVSDGQSGESKVGNKMIKCELVDMHYLHNGGLRLRSNSFIRSRRVGSGDILRDPTLYKSIQEHFTSSALKTSNSCSKCINVSAKDNGRRGERATCSRGLLDTRWIMDDRNETSRIPAGRDFSLAFSVFGVMECTLNQKRKEWAKPNPCIRVDITESVVPYGACGSSGSS